MIPERLRFHTPEIKEDKDGHHAFWTGAGGKKISKKIPAESVEKHGFDAITAGCKSHKFTHRNLMTACADFATTLDGPEIDLETVSDRTIRAAFEVFVNYGFVLNTNSQLIPEAQDLPEEPFHAPTVCVNNAIKILKRHRTNI